MQVPWLKGLILLVVPGAAVIKAFWRDILAFYRAV
jgi:hypothetical protein